MFTKAGRIMTAESMNLYRLLLGVTLVFFTAFIVDENFLFIFSATYASGWFWLSLSGVIALGIGDYFGIRMYTILSVRTGSVLSTLAPAVALILGTLLLSERMNIIGLVGMFITLVGVMTMSLGRQERQNIPDHGHGSVTRGIIYGIISAACNGAALVLSKKGFVEQSTADNTVHPLTGSFIRFIAAAIVVLIFMLFKKLLVKNIKNILSQPPDVLKTATIGVLLGPLLAVSFAMMAIQTLNAAVTQTIFSLVPVVALLISHFILKERITKNSLLGVGVAVVGVVVLIWREEVLQLIR